ncbi:putative A disintegrin and metalloproteinase with thrombospondin motifs 8 isoform X1 [Penaeus vannamei]|uniref:Putative A disintegrin and metalloproteinase with thrombospondin motifs 8 isoform X1 n=1 Tax=Penaeus vannamei TaxID=6689 RepID=A0A3R7QJA9_PENVA|nr:putative A disintegrin and metalloproteinase with thrombospondin motifs 8 isoform X1 [Penaeus vannamei]
MSIIAKFPKPKSGARPENRTQMTGHSDLPLQPAPRGRISASRAAGEAALLDAQCRKDRGTSACFKDDRVCAQLFCFDASSGYCVSYRPAAEGSDCGNGRSAATADVSTITATASPILMCTELDQSLPDTMFIFVQTFRSGEHYLFESTQIKPVYTDPPSSTTPEPPPLPQQLAFITHTALSVTVHNIPTSTVIICITIHTIPVPIIYIPTAALAFTIRTIRPHTTMPPSPRLHLHTIPSLHAPPMPHRPAFTIRTIPSPPHHPAPIARTDPLPRR